MSAGICETAIVVYQPKNKTPHKYRTITKDSDQRRLPKIFYLCKKKSGFQEWIQMF